MGDVDRDRAQQQVEDREGTLVALLTEAKKYLDEYDTEYGDDSESYKSGELATLLLKIEEILKHYDE